MVSALYCLKQLVGNAEAYDYGQKNTLIELRPAPVFRAAFRTEGVFLVIGGAAVFADRHSPRTRIFIIIHFFT